VNLEKVGLGMMDRRRFGFGRGLFGEGEFGFDADEISWESGELETGKHRFCGKDYGQVRPGE